MRKWKTGGPQRDPGAWTSLANFYPTLRGSYRTAPILAALGTAAGGPATPGTPLAAIALPLADGTPIAYLGTSTKIYSATATNFQSGTFTDRSKGGGYTASQWSFAQFGNITIAGNNSDNTQYRDATTANAFADLAGAPKAKIFVVQSNVVMALCLSAANNSWASSDVGDYTNWTTGDAVASTAILAKPGAITAGIAFRDIILVFKRNAVFQMRYVGSPVYWQVDLIEDGRGCNGIGLVGNCGNFVIFAGDHGMTIYDGNSFRDITDDFVTESGNTFALTGDTSATVYLPAEKSVVVYNAGVSAVVYNLRQDAFGQFSWYKNGATGSSGYVGLAGPPSARADVQGGVAKTIQSRGLCVLDPAANPCVLTTSNAFTPAGSVVATLRTEWMGDEKQEIFWDRLTPVSANPESYASVAAAGMTLTGSLADKPSLGNSDLQSISAITSADNTNRFDIGHVSRFAQWTLSVTGAFYELDDVAVVSKPAGKN